MKEQYTKQNFNTGKTTSRNCSLALIVGQAPPEKKYKLPFGKTRLYKWFKQIGLSEEYIIQNFEFEALVNKFPGKSSNGHKIPNSIDIQKHLPKILKKLKNNKIKVMIPVGKLAIQYTLDDHNIELKDIIGKKVFSKAFGKSDDIITIIPLPHPSGLSTWVYDDNNGKLLALALELIKSETIH